MIIYDCCLYGSFLDVFLNNLKKSEAAEMEGENLFGLESIKWDRSIRWGGIFKNCLD